MAAEAAFQMAGCKEASAPSAGTAAREEAVTGTMRVRRQGAGRGCCIIG
jgi:hypothetical protein